MKKIEAIIRPRKLEAVRNALVNIGVKGMTVTSVNGMGEQEGYIEMYRGIEYQVDFLKKIKLEIIIEEDRLDECIAVINNAARTGQIGDGKIFITHVERVIRIRSGQEDIEAM